MNPERRAGPPVTRGVAEALAEGILEGMNPARVVLAGEERGVAEALGRRGVLAVAPGQAPPPEVGIAAGLAPVDDETLAQLVEARRWIVLGAGLGDAREPSALAHLWAEGFCLDLVETDRLRAALRAARAPEVLERGLAAFRRAPCEAAELGLCLREAEAVEGFATPDELRLLFAAALGVPEGRALVEIGCWKGRATVILSHGAGHGAMGPVYAVDHHRGDPALASRLGVALDGVSSWPELTATLQAMVSRVEVVPVLADSLVTVADWAGLPVGLLLLDGSPEAVDLRIDLDAWRPHLAPGAVVLLREADEPGPRRVLEEALAAGHLVSPGRVDGTFWARAPGIAEGA